MKKIITTIAAASIVFGMALTTHAQLIVDFGDNLPTAQIVYPGASAFNGEAGPDEESVPVSETFGGITVAVDTFDGTIEYRNRASSYSGGAASFIHSEFGQIGAMLQDNYKRDGTPSGAGNSHYLEIQLSGLAAGGYNYTSFHHDYFGVPSYDYANFDVQVDIDGGGFSTELSNLDTTISDNPITNPTEVDLSFVSPGTSSTITIRYQQVAAGGDSSDIPISGFFLAIPEPSTAMLLMTGGLAIALFRRRRR